MSTLLMRSARAQASAAVSLIASSVILYACTTASSDEPSDDPEIRPPQARRLWFHPSPPILLSTTTPPLCHCEQQQAGPKTADPAVAPTQASPTQLQRLNRFSRLRRIQTIRRRMDKVSVKETPVESVYDIDPTPLGVGAFGAVHLAIRRDTGERVALKRIPKLGSAAAETAADESFRNEISALLRIRTAGGHPHICALRESFDEGAEYYCLALELVSGGEMFDHLAKNGAYSEADAARLVREVASSLAFLHGIGITHADLKPENLMLSSEQASDAVVKLVDFGCAVLKGDMDDEDDQVLDDTELKEIERELETSSSVERTKTNHALTPSYSPPEAFDDDRPIEPSLDMWSLGVILFISKCTFCRFIWGP
jgi:tRNA A-37 threonylcarbamoyl transferase component Bud32